MRNGISFTFKERISRPSCFGGQSIVIPFFGRLNQICFNFAAIQKSFCDGIEEVFPQLQTTGSRVNCSNCSAIIVKFTPHSEQKKVSDRIIYCLYCHLFIHRTKIKPQRFVIDCPSFNKINFFEAIPAYQICFDYTKINEDCNV